MFVPCRIMLSTKCPDIPSPGIAFSAARILEIKWLAGLFYPDMFHYNMRQEIHDFYGKFYHRNPSEAEVNELLQYSLK